MNLIWEIKRYYSNGGIIERHTEVEGKAKDRFFIHVTVTPTIGDVQLPPHGRMFEIKGCTEIGHAYKKCQGVADEAAEILKKEIANAQGPKIITAKQGPNGPIVQP